MIFVTAGSMLPFDRLFRIIDDAVDSGILRGDLLGQIGRGRYTPRNFPTVEMLDAEQFEAQLAGASLVIGHAGIGTITQALAHAKPLLVLPRRAQLGEAVNDHQVATARRFEDLGHVLSFERESLPQKLQALEHFSPRPRKPNARGVAARIGDFLHQEIQRRRL